MRDAAFNDPWSLLKAITPGIVGPRRVSEMHRYREYPVPSGRIDLLLVCHKRLIVVEFKANTADEGAVAQVLRYASHFKKAGYDFVGRVFCIVAAPEFTESAMCAAHSAEVSLVKIQPSLSYSIHADGDGVGVIPMSSDDPVFDMFMRSTEARHGLEELAPEEEDHGSTMPLAIPAMIR
jgi:hypothetical protein